MLNPFFVFSDPSSSKFAVFLLLLFSISLFMSASSIFLNQTDVSFPSHNDSSGKFSKKDLTSPYPGYSQ